MRRSIIIAILLALVVLAVMVGCGYQGEMVKPENPTIIFYNAPPDSTVFGSAPVLWWFGTDKDGRIIEYAYIDIPKGKLGDDVLYESYYTGAVEIPETVRIGGGKAITWIHITRNVDTVFLSLEPGDSITEHLFCVKSIDQDSNASKPECRIFYRINTPPDTMRIKYDPEKMSPGDTFWMLHDTTEEWGGVEFTWTAHDPDNSVILEYYWWVENYDDPSEVVRTSLADDSLGGIYSGMDSTDGWVRSTSTILRDIPTGHWRFIIKVRDDAFYTGAHDTFEFYAVRPYFDPSDSAIHEQIVNDIFPHRLLAIFAVMNTPNPDWGWNDDIGDFYTSIFDELVAAGHIESYDTMIVKGLAGMQLPINKFLLGNYSIVYVFHRRVMIPLGLSMTTIEELADYIVTGGRVVFDGNGIFDQAADLFPNPNERIVVIMKTVPFKLFGITGRGDFAGRITWAEASHPDFPDMHIDTSKAAHDDENDYYYFGNVRYIALFPYFAGVPYVEPIYRAGDYPQADSITRVDLIGHIIGGRFASRNYRSVYFTFPLYYMDNSTGAVSDALDKVFEFLTTTFEKPKEEEERL
ncbi:hypothetical protein J7J62_05880 [bacterium]|nr:hypothetical protein [bacterium]